MSEITTEQMLHHHACLSRDCPNHDFDQLIRCPKCAAIRARLTKYDAIKAEVERRCIDAAKIIKVRDDALARADKAEAEVERLNKLLLAKVSTKYKAKVPVFKDLLERLEKAEAALAAGVCLGCYKQDAFDKANAISVENCEYQKKIRDLEADLASARPLIEAVELGAVGQFQMACEQTYQRWPDVTALLASVLAYRAAQEAKGKP